MTADRYMKAVLTVRRGQRRATWRCGFSNNNLLLEAPDHTLRVVDVEGNAPQFPKIKMLIRWE